MPDLASSISGGETPPLPAVWPELCRRFREPKLIGQGTCADVYAAFDSVYNRKVALKIAKTSELSSRARSAANAQAGGVGEDHSKRTRIEGELLRAFRHRNIIECYEILDCNDERSGQRYVVLVLEYAAGGELYQFLSTMQTLLSETEARRFFRQIVSAVAFCHERAIVHRDLKLENILLSSRQDPVVKLADFGLAERFDQTGRELLATYCGSLLYASPELMQNRPYRGPEVDCWALGVILYSLVCGRMPFRTADPAATAHIANLSSYEHAMLTGKIVRAEFDLPETVRRNRPLADLVSGLLNPDASRRYNCAQILNHTWLTGQQQQVMTTGLTSSAPHSAFSQTNANANPTLIASQHNNAMMLGQHHLALTNAHASRANAISSTNPPRFATNSFGNQPLKASHNEQAFGGEPTNNDTEMAIVPIPLSAPKRYNQPHTSANMAFRSTHNVNAPFSNPPLTGQQNVSNSITPQMLRRTSASARNSRASADRDVAPKQATRLDSASRTPTVNRTGERRKTTTGFDSQTQRELEALFGVSNQSVSGARWAKPTPAISASDLSKLADSPPDASRHNAFGFSSNQRDDGKSDATNRPNFAPSMKTDAENFRFADDDDEEPEATGFVSSSIYATMPRNRRRAGALPNTSSGMHLNAKTAALLSSEAERLTEIINGVNTPSLDAVSTGRAGSKPNGSNDAATDRPSQGQDAADRVSLSEMLPLSISAFRERFGKSTDSDPNNNQQRRADADHKAHVYNDEANVAAFSSSNDNDRLDSSPDRVGEPVNFTAEMPNVALRATSTTPVHTRSAFGSTQFNASSVNQQQHPFAVSSHAVKPQTNAPHMTTQSLQLTSNYQTQQNQLVSNSPFLAADSQSHAHNHNHNQSASYGHQSQAQPPTSSMRPSFGVPSHVDSHNSRSTAWPQHAASMASSQSAQQQYNNNDHSAFSSSQFHDPLSLSGRTQFSSAFSSNARTSPRTVRRTNPVAPTQLYTSMSPHGDERGDLSANRNVVEPRWKVTDTQPQYGGMASRSTRAAPTSAPVQVDKIARQPDPFNMQTSHAQQQPIGANVGMSRLITANPLIGRSAIDVNRTGRTQPSVPLVPAPAPSNPPTGRLYTSTSANHYGTMANIAQTGSNSSNGASAYNSNALQMQPSAAGIQQGRSALASGIQPSRSVRRSAPAPRAAPLNNAQSMHNIVNAGQPHASAFEYDSRRAAPSYGVGNVGRSTLTLAHGEDSEYDFATLSSASGGSHEQRRAASGAPVRSQTAFTGGIGAGVATGGNGSSRFDRDYHEFGGLDRGGYFGASRPKSAGMFDDFETHSDTSDYEGEPRFALGTGTGITMR